MPVGRLRFHIAARVPSLDFTKEEHMDADPSGPPRDPLGHPKGTLAIIGLYGLLFLVGWLVIYFFVFLPRGPLTQ
ncbi:MAG: cytochrome c oxidase subunit 2A [Gemmatimonadota bacterium]|nr:cytochrome c oxidase subunit 2A [Gemmatimonadota bacterium]